ncbi:predicted PurR-regulated permease PerM [Rhizobium subbaraonis]|uniref:Predicted PurR-regulated permease PerM n=1 Tax=Rhizobium subbaraonis TaxID=908946 RepID=A0A285UZ50_9HYPH|nr:AI-2E family transporter [Rhizobium subbaraonis]SOC47063.1 predicted PurR-regulated permease PerM [Rhizobium subbaraonis]
MRQPRDNTFVWLTIAVSLAFAWMLWPLSGAILWAVVLAVLFAPVNDAILKTLAGRPNLAALSTLVIVLVMVILPFALIASFVVREASSVYQNIAAGQFAAGVELQALREMLPDWLKALLDSVGLPDAAALRARLLNALAESGQFLAGQAINIGQSTFHLVLSAFVMLYLLFFLLRDGRGLVRLVGDALPLSGGLRQALFGQFVLTINALVKGGIVVALVQGVLGGLIFWVLDIRAAALWGAVMAIFALLPMVGTGLVWGPTAIYLLASGDIWEGMVLLAFGVLVIGLVDNLLRPVLIGKETKIPDYLVLVSTLGGIATFGPNGVVVGPMIAALFLAVWAVFPALMSDLRGDGVDKDRHDV